MRVDFEKVRELREIGSPWPTIAQLLGFTGSHKALMKRYARWAKRAASPVEIVKAADAAAGDTSYVKLLTAEQVSRITSLEDLIEFFKVDLEKWEVTGYRVNKWEQHSAAAGVVPLYQVRATLRARATDEERAIERSIRDAIGELRDASALRPRVEPVAVSISEGDPVLYTVHVYDPHLGMLSWAPETGASYDLKIAASDYSRATDHLIALSDLYPVERYLIVVGHDTGHVDMAGIGRRGGTTANGTPQDVDGRLAKQFTIMRKVAVASVEKALARGKPIDVVVVPGNHDRETMYKLGEVLAAWFRNEPLVTIVNDPKKRHYYGYGENVLMMTHGEEYRRQRDNLPLIFATECPPDLWTAARYREILTGHNHVSLAGRYLPTSDQNETRGIRVRSLPGLTPEDAWHTDEGYRHTRAATAIAYRRSGGIAGLHEFNLWGEAP